MNEKKVPTGRSLAGKVAAITGAGSGNGRAIARRLSKEGASVFASDLRQDLLTALESEFDEAGSVIASGVFDASKVGDAERFVTAVMDRFGRIDILVNNAGGIRAEPFPEVSEDGWD